MTNKDIQTIAASDHNFRVQVLTDLAAIKQKQNDHREDLDGVKRTLYGPNGDDGVVGDVNSLKQSTKAWNKGLAVIQAVLAAVLVAIGIKMK